MEGEQETLAGGVNETLGSSTSGEIELRQGDTLDHFVVQDQIGQGAMGVVLAALDPDLGRRVAIKLVLPRAGTSSEADQIRMLREAQSMAKITHPNVVTVHEVGFARGQLFIAMEFIDGRTLRKWTHERVRTLAEVLDVHRAAGRGLAAAHAAGLVHRDFKPDNVLVGRDGRVVVTDFGLVSIAGAAAPSGTLGSTGRQVVTTGDVSQTLTTTGSLLGTPAYMPAEQFRNQPVDARADQFAFCVALWEALYGKRPFVGKTLVELVEATLGGVPDPPGDRPAIRGRVPRRIRRALERGLLAEPDARWPDMTTLLAELRRDRGASKAWIAVGSASAAAVVAATVWVLTDGEDGPRCDLGSERTAEVWNADARGEIAAALERSGATDASAIAAAVGERFDRWAEQWSAAYRDACEATHVRGEQSMDRLDRRMSCLARNREEAQLLVNALAATSDRAAAGQAPAAAGALASVAHCEADALDVWDHERIAPEHREEAAAVRSGLDRAMVEERLGHTEQALAMLEALLPRAETLGEQLVLAEVLTQTGKLMAKSGRLAEAEPLLRRAAAAAAEAGVPAVEASAWMALADAVGTQLGDPKRAMGILAGAESAVRRADEQSLDADYERTVGGLMYLEQRYDEAETHLKSAIELERGSPDASGRDLGASYNVLATLYGSLARPDDAMAAYELAEASWREYYGENHPNVAALLNNMGAQYRTMGRRDDARKQHLAALEKLRTSVGEEHPWVAMSYEGLGILALEQNELDEAHEHQSMALAIRRTAYGPDHPTVASSLSNLAGIDLLRGKPADAAESWLRAREILVASYGPTSVQVAEVDTNLGSAQFQLGQFEAAELSYGNALVVTERAYGPDHPGLVVILSGLADVRARADRCADALEPIARAKALASKHGLADDASLAAIEAKCATPP